MNEPSKTDRPLSLAKKLNQKKKEKKKRESRAHPFGPSIDASFKGEILETKKKTDQKKRDPALEFLQRNREIVGGGWLTWHESSVRDCLQIS
jgi:hypothetical protein